MRPMSRRAVQNATGATTDWSNWLEISGDIHMTANTPRRAIDISTPMARAISLPSNHFAIAFDTVVPAISQPQPKIMKPNEAILALPGNDTHQLSSHSHKAVLSNHSLTPTSLMDAPITIMDADSSPVKRMPILSRIMPANIRKKKNTFRKYSEAAYVPKDALSQCSFSSKRDFRGDITSTNM